MIARTQKIPPETVTIDKTFAELKIDSLDGINILFALESEFNLDIPDEAARQIRSVREMVEGIEKLLAAKTQSHERAPRGGYRHRRGLARFGDAFGDFWTGMAAGQKRDPADDAGSAGTLRFPNAAEAARFDPLRHFDEKEAGFSGPLRAVRGGGRARGRGGGSGLKLPA